MRCTAPSKCKTLWSSATQASPRIAVLNSGSAFTSATWLRRATGISWATASISPRASKASASLAASVSPSRHTGRARLDLTINDLGPTQLKNIAERIRVYSLQVGVPAKAKPATPAEPQAPRPVPDKPSIAVLAFNNMSGDAEQEYFSDGISEDIITDLSKLSELHVIARNSSFVYKKAAVSVPDAAKALGVRYVLEGSVRKAGNRVRVTAQLIDSTSGG